MANKKEDDLLELAWRTAFNSQTYDVIDNGDESQDVLNSAKQHIRDIDKDEWFPEARLILRKDGYIDDHRLAEMAATKFINRKMGTKSLIVTFGGDW